jgi:adenylate kinase family enzyme
MPKESSLGDLLRSYWDSLPEEKKRKAERKRQLLAAFSLVDDTLQPFSAPAALMQEEEKEILVLYAANTTALKALKQRARELPREIEELLGLHVDEVRVILRPQSQIDAMRRMTGIKTKSRDDQD